MGNNRANISSRNPFIDFLKGICILFVIFAHNCPARFLNKSGFFLWGGMAVPLFLLLQSFHVFQTDKLRRELGLPTKSLITQYDLKRLSRRIILPFIIITSATGIILILLGNNPISIAKRILLYGGLGPGSYYVLIYIQFFFLIPLALIFINKWKQKSVLFIIIISQCLEWFCIWMEIPQLLYRVLCFRYIFLIYLGYYWVEKSIYKKFSYIDFSFSVISLIILIIINYSTVSLHPLLFDSEWRIFHWICYFYPAIILIRVIKFLFNLLPPKYRIVVEILGKHSYEIFTLQMCVFSIFPYFFTPTGVESLDSFLVISATTILSIIPVYIWKKSKFLFKYRLKLKVF